MSKNPIIKGSKFILREIDLEKDKKSYVQNLNNPEVMKWIVIDYPYTEEYWELFIKKIKKAREEKVGASFVIDVDGKAVGNVNLSVRDVKCFRHIGKFAYFIGQNYWGHGIMTEAVKLVSDYAFNKLGLLKLKLDFMETNIGSQRVAEKNGFKFEAKMINDAFKLGKYHNVIYTTKFKEGFNDK